MKNPDRKTVARLEQLPNIGQAIAADLRMIGIDHPQQLIGKDPLELYEELCRSTGTRHDPCVADVFMSAVSFMEGDDPSPWWAYTRERKKRMNQDG